MIENAEVWLKIPCGCGTNNWIMATDPILDAPPEGVRCCKCQKVMILDEEFSQEKHGNWPVEKLLEVAMVVDGLKEPT